MPCYKPLTAWRGRGGLCVFKRSEAVWPQELQLPCGQCIGCRLEYSRQWAMRIVHESRLYEENCFVTLTYDEDNVPEDGSLNKSHFQDFFKRLRSRYAPRRIRYFHCGEYGEQFSRPHYHACVFNFDFPDKKFFKNVGTERLYTSAILEDIWGRGFCTVGDVTFESAAYVARYVLKKITGEDSYDHYWKLCESTGELVRVEPEYCTMSRRPGIGAAWSDEFRGDTLRDDSVVLRGIEMKPPRYYDKRYDVTDPDVMRANKQARVREGRKRKADNTWDRLHVREHVKRAQLKLLKRGFEE